METSFYTSEELLDIGLRSVGDNVHVSRKSSIYGASTISLGNDVRIDDFCIISGNIRIGNNVHIAAQTSLYGGTAGIIIDDYANISSRVGIFAISDDYSGLSMTNPTIPDKFKNVQNEAVHICRHVIIGTGCTVLPGVVLSEGAAFGAMTLIDHSSEPWSVNVGIPYRRIHDRERKILELTEIFEMEKRNYEQN